MLLMNIKEMLKYENAEIIQRNMKIASVLCRNFPSSIQRVNKYIDIISSLFIIKGNVDNKANKILNDYLKNIYEKNYKNTKISIDINPNNMI